MSIIRMITPHIQNEPHFKAAKKEYTTMFFIYKTAVDAMESFEQQIEKRVESMKEKTSKEEIEAVSAWIKSKSDYCTEQRRGMRTLSTHLQRAIYAIDASLNPATETIKEQFPELDLLIQEADKLARTKFPQLVQQYEVALSESVNMKNNVDNLLEKMTQVLKKVNDSMREFRSFEKEKSQEPEDTTYVKIHWPNDASDTSCAYNSEEEWDDEDGGIFSPSSFYASSSSFSGSSVSSFSIGLSETQQSPLSGLNSTTKLSRSKTLIDIFLPEEGEGNFATPINYHEKVEDSFGLDALVSGQSPFYTNYSSSSASSCSKDVLTIQGSTPCPLSPQFAQVREKSGAGKGVVGDSEKIFPNYPLRRTFSLIPASPIPMATPQGFARDEEVDSDATSSTSDEEVICTLPQRKTPLITRTITQKTLIPVAQPKSRSCDMSWLSCYTETT